MRRLFALLLRFHPRPYRARFGPEIVEHAAEECARACEHSLLRGMGCVVATCLDLAWSGLLERWSPTWPGHTTWESRNGRGGEGRMRQWLRQIRHAIHTLGKAPGFTASAVLTLALALGANAGIFSMVDAVLLDPLPYESPDRLVHIAASAPGSDMPDEFGVSAEFYAQYRDEATQLESVATFNSFTATVRAGERAERLRLSVPSSSLFETLGVAPILGRLAEEGEGGRVALLSHALWTTWFGQDPSVIGRTYEFIGEPMEVIGVMGPEFRFPRDEGEVMAWLPVEVREVTNPGQFGLDLVGRMAPGADHESLARELDVLASRLPELYGGSPGYARLIEHHVPVVKSLEEWVVGPLTEPLWTLMGAVVVVLLVACANVANLFAVRSEGRGRDLAVRRAIGAARGELFRFQLAEAFVVAALAAVGALALAWLAVPVFLAAAPGELARIADVRVSPATMAFTVGAAFVAALLCGLVPAVRASEPDLDRLRDGARGSTRRRHWARDGLVVSQTTLTLVLLVGSGLLMRTFKELRSVDPGYDTTGVLTFQFAPEQAHLTDGPSWAAFHREMMERIRGLPDVEAVGLVETVPLDEGAVNAELVTEATATDAEGRPRGAVTLAAGDYFQAMGIEVLRGRAFTEEDLSVPGRVVVSRSAAEMLWPGEAPIGKRVRSSVLQDWHTVVGVVEDVRPYDLRNPPVPLIYYPIVGPEPEAWWSSSPGYTVRTDRPDAVMPEIRALIQEMAPEAPVYRVYTMQGLVARSTVELSFTMLTLGVAAALALVLGAIGLYGVLSHAVAERTREIGVRMALGAEATQVRRMVVREGARIVGLGIVLGLCVALVATRALSGLLYGVQAVDPWTFAVMSLALAAVGLMASWVPARRASRVDPMESMRVG